jgi:hypothetical protein
MTFSGFLTQIYKKLLNSAFQFTFDVHSGVGCGDTNIGGKAQCPESEISEFTVAPQVNPIEGLPHHEWLIAFSKMPHDLGVFSAILDKKMCELNVYYKDLIVGNVLKPLV